MRRFFLSVISVFLLMSLIVTFGFCAFGDEADSVVLDEAAAVEAGAPEDAGNVESEIVVTEVPEEPVYEPELEESYYVGELDEAAYYEEPTEPVYVGELETSATSAGTGDYASGTGTAASGSGQHNFILSEETGTNQTGADAQAAGQDTIGAGSDAQGSDASDSDAQNSDVAEVVEHNYILIIDNSKSTTHKHSLGDPTDPKGLRFDAARLVYDNVLLTAQTGDRGQIGVIVFCGPNNCVSYGPLPIETDPKELAETIGNYLNEAANESHRDNYTDIRTALQTASDMMSGFAEGGDTSIILLTDGINDLTDRGDPFDTQVNIEANDDSVALVDSIYQNGADFYVVALTTEEAVQNTEAFLVFINRLAAAGGGEQLEDGSYSNVLLATQSDLNSKLLQMLIKAESSSDTIQNIVDYTPLLETFTVPYEGITDATVNITFMPDDKEYLDKVELVTPAGEDLILWDQEGLHEQQGITVGEDRSYIILEIPSPQAGEWSIIITGRADILQTSMSIDDLVGENEQAGTDGQEGTAEQAAVSEQTAQEGANAPAGQGAQAASGDGLSDEVHPVLVDVVVRFNHNMNLVADLAESYVVGAPAQLNVRFQTWNGTEFADLTDSDIYSQSTAELILWAPGAEEPFATIPMEVEADHYTASFTPDAGGEWKAQVNVENLYFKYSLEDLTFEVVDQSEDLTSEVEDQPEDLTSEVAEIPEVIMPEDVELYVYPSIDLDDGTTYLSRDVEYVTLDWEVTGETDSEEAALLEDGKVIRKNLEHEEELDLSRLEDGKQYALQLTIMPKNGIEAGADPVVESLPFQLAPVVVPIKSITLDIQPRMDDRDEMTYIDNTADEWTVSWVIESEDGTIEIIDALGTRDDAGEIEDTDDTDHADAIDTTEGADDTGTGVLADNADTGDDTDAADATEGADDTGTGVLADNADTGADTDVEDAADITDAIDIYDLVDSVNVALYEEGSDEPLISDLLSEDVTDEPTLEEDKTYILRVEAMPKNGLLLGAEPFIQELAFQIYPEAEPVTGLVLEVTDGTLTDASQINGNTTNVNGSENISSGSIYQMKKNTADLAWRYDSGNVDHFELNVTDPLGGTFLQKSLASGTGSFTLEMDKNQRGVYRVELTAVPRYAQAGDEDLYAHASVMVSPHIPGFIEKYWPFLAGGVGLIVLVIVLLLILKSSKAPRIFGTLQIDCDDPDLSFHKHLDFIPDRQGLKYGQPITLHPLLAAMQGQKPYELLKNVHVSMTVADASGKISGEVETGTVTHRPNASVISLTCKDPKTGAVSTCFVGQYDIGTSSMVLKDGAGREYTFQFGTN